ncbi:MAG: hypothetical protein ABSC94_12380 [Polyangiaceae bacterium]
MMARFPSRPKPAVGSRPTPGAPDAKGALGDHPAPVLRCTGAGRPAGGAWSRWVGLCAALVLTGGCATNSNSSAEAVPLAEPTTNYRPYTPDAGMASDASDAGPNWPGPFDASVVQAAAGNAQVVQGSPLCNASQLSRCYPDDPTTERACGTSSDGGPYLAGEGDPDAALGCEVVLDVEAGIAQECRPAGVGVDGTSCTTSVDCAPSFECVGTPGAAKCRQYCCSASCDAKHFCDVQPEAAGADGSTITVPVCMPILTCSLPGETRDAGACAADQTCAVVTMASGNALTGCVMDGPASVGESCDGEHCAHGLMCSGPLGSRVCAELCETSVTDASTPCTPPQVCLSGLPLFPNPATGICANPVTGDD